MGRVDSLVNGALDLGIQKPASLRGVLPGKRSNVVVDLQQGIRLEKTNHNGAVGGVACKGTVVSIERKDIGRQVAVVVELGVVGRLGACGACKRSCKVNAQVLLIDVSKRTVNVAALELFENP